MSDRLRLGILATHPVQYHAPVYRELTARHDVELSVFFASRPTAAEQGVGFGVPFEWDIDVTSGYEARWLRNRARGNAAASFAGSDTPEIASIIRDERFDAFLVMGWHARTYWQAIAACWRRGVPVLVRGDSQLLTDAKHSKRLAKRMIYPLFMRRFAACLSVGTRSEAYFWHYGARHVVRSPHFVDNHYFGEAARRLARERGAIRARWGLPEDALVCLFAGKLEEKKRPLDIVCALEQTRGRKVWALFVGDGPLRRECEEAALRRGVHARFVGFLNQSEMPEAYAASDVLVLPSDARETWGLVVNEAMASGRAAIVSDAAGCVPDLVTPGRTGYAVPVGDRANLAHCILRLEGDRQLCAHMGAAARDHVRSFSAVAAADGILRAARAPSGWVV